MSKPSRLDRNFYSDSAVTLAPRLIGKLLCRKCGGKIIRRRITETECYFGEEDTACHAHRGKTPRTQILYEAGGMAYIYLCYGIHSLLNVVTGDEGHPEAVLIRGIEGAAGPGRVTKLFGIDRTLNGTDLCISDELWLEDDGMTPEYTTDKRVGIDYADRCDRDRQWRYIMKP